MASDRHNKWLQDESIVWVADGLLSAEQAARLREQYPVSAGMSWGRFLLTAIGAIIFGLGIVLFFAYNWSGLHKYLKLALIFSTVFIAHGLALFYSSRRRDQNLREGLHVLGTMTYGAGIWLIAQIYHMDEHYPTAFALWGLGALVFAWVLPSVIQGLIATLLLTVWGMSEIAGFESVHYPGIPVMVLGVVPLAWRLKSRTLLFCAVMATLLLGFGNVLLLFDENILFYLLFALAILLMCLAIAARYTSFPASGDVLRTIGITGYAILLFVISFEDSVRALIFNQPQESAFTVSLCALGIAIACWAVLFVHRYTAGAAVLQLAEILLVLIAIVVVSLILLRTFYDHVGIGILLINAVLACHCVLLIMIGTDKLNWRHVAIGCLTLALIVYLRFNDLFQSLLMRSLVFLILGAILFFIGHIYARQSSLKTASHSAPLDASGKLAPSVERGTNA